MRALAGTLRPRKAAFPLFSNFSEPPLWAQFETFAPQSTNRLALRGLLMPSRSCCLPRAHAGAPDGARAASTPGDISALVASAVNADTSAVNAVLTLTLRSLARFCGRGGDPQRQYGLLAATKSHVHRAGASWRGC